MQIRLSIYLSIYLSASLLHFFKSPDRVQGGQYAGHELYLPPLLSLRSAQVLHQRPHGKPARSSDRL